ncbi:MAG: Ig-like domain-containing protein [Gemmatimonadaceae bacterium]
MRRSLSLASPALIAAILVTGCKDSSSPEAPGAPTDIAISAGNAQTGTAGSTLIAPIAAKVQDAKGRGVPNIMVTFLVQGLGGAVSPTAARTNGAGIVTTSWTLPTIAGSSPIVKAVLVDTLTGALVDSVSFTAHVVSGAPISMQWVTLPAVAPTGSSRAVTVTLFDQYGNRSTGATVDWKVTAGGGTVTPASSVSDAAGVAGTSWTLGTTPGVNRMTATSGTLTANFAIDGRVAGQADAMYPGSYNSVQPVGATVPLSVTVRDAFNAAVSGATVTWRVTQGGGSVAAPTSVTDASGVATMNVTVGNVGYNTFEASSGTATATFTIESRVLADRLTNTDGSAFGIARTTAGNVVVALIDRGWSRHSPNRRRRRSMGQSPVAPPRSSPPTPPAPSPTSRTWPAGSTSSTSAATPTSPRSPSPTHMPSRSRRQATAST